MSVTNHAGFLREPQSKTGPWPYKTFTITVSSQAAAQQAQANAAAAAAKAAAAGLGGQHKDASHEGTAPEQYQAAPQSQEQDSQEYYHQLQSDYHH